MTEQSAQRFEMEVYSSRREVLMSIIAQNTELVQYYLEAGIAALPWGLGPIAALGIKRTMKIDRTELWRLPMRLLAETTDEAFDETYNQIMPFLRDL
jgi:hypothetical protein